VELRIYDLAGRLVRTLVDGPRAAGVNQVTWDGTDARGRAVASGTYYARLIAGEQVQVRPLVLVR
jgi:flagellar hook assembly protein FlgD